MITILLQKILTSLTSLLTGLVTSLTAIDEALDVPVIVKTVAGAVCNFTANIARRCYSVKTTISASGGGGTPSEPVPIVGADSVSVFQSGSNTSQYIETIIEFDDTCYGAEIDVISGKLTYITGFVTDLSQLEWTYQEQYGRFRSGDLVGTVKPFENSVIADNMLCSCFTNGTANQTGAGQYDNIIAISNGGYICIKASSTLGDVDALKTILENQSLVYPLLNNLVEDISPINIIPEIGENNIWFDSGNDTTVIYYEKLED